MRGVLAGRVAGGPALVALLFGRLDLAGTAGFLVFVLVSLSLVATVRAERREPVSYVVDDTTVTANWRTGSRAFEIGSLKVERSYSRSPFYPPAARVMADDRRFVVLEDLEGFEELVAALEKGRSVESAASPQLLSQAPGRAHRSRYRRR